MILLLLIISEFDFLMIVRQVSEIVFGMLTLAYFNISLVTVVVLTVIMGIVPNMFSKILAKRSLEYILMLTND